MVNPTAQKVVKWLALTGRVRLTETGFVYLPEQPDSAENTTPGKDVAMSNNYALAKTDLFFASGSVEFTVKLDDNKSLVQLVLNHGTPKWTYIGLNTAPHAYLIAASINRYQILDGAGTFGNFDVQREYALRIEVSGPTVTLWVEGVQVCKTDTPIVNSQLAMYVAGNSSVEIKNFRLKNLQARVFVVMQFTPEYNALYNEVIKPVSEEFGFECVRGDDVYNQGLIVEDIARSIRDATVVIADVTPDNPNVFYEVGYSHGMGKSTILLSDRKREHLPFDVAGYRTLFYDNTIGGKSAVERNLRLHFNHLKA